MPIGPMEKIIPSTAEETRTAIDHAFFKGLLLIGALLSGLLLLLLLAPTCSSRQKLSSPTTKTNLSKGGFRLKLECVEHFNFWFKKTQV